MMRLDTWINDEDYVVWLWQTSHDSVGRAPAGSRPFAEAAIHALLSTLRATDCLGDLQRRYHESGPEALAMVRSILSIGLGNPASGLLSDADYEWLLVLEDAAFYQRYCEIAGHDSAPTNASSH